MPAVDFRLPSSPPHRQGGGGEEERAERLEVAAVDRDRVGGDEIRDVYFTPQSSRN